MGQLFSVTRIYVESLCDTKLISILLWKTGLIFKIMLIDYFCVIK